MIPDAALIRDEIARFDRGGGGGERNWSVSFLRRCCPKNKILEDETIATVENEAATHLTEN